MVLRWGIANEIEAGPDCLEQDLTSAIREALPLIRQLAGKPKHVPAMNSTARFAKRLVEHLKRAGIEKV